MSINEVNGAQQAQPTRKIETKKDSAGNPVNCIFEDRNGDGKLDLYSVTKINPSFDGCTHEITYFDNDGDGYFDLSQEKVTCNMTSNSKRLSQNDKLTTNEYTVKDESTKMENLLADNKQGHFLKKADVNIQKIITIDTNKKIASNKEITENDLKDISDKRPTEAVNILMEKSPVGKTLPSDDELAKMGYKKQPYMTMNGDTFYGNNLTISTGLLEAAPEGTARKAVYKAGRFEQVMYYDKDNNLIKGNFKIMDNLEGKFPEAHYEIFRNENGGYSYIN